MRNLSKNITICNHSFLRLVDVEPYNIVVCAPLVLSVGPIQTIKHTHTQHMRAGALNHTAIYTTQSTMAKYNTHGHFWAESGWSHSFYYCVRRHDTHITNGNYGWLSCVSISFSFASISRIKWNTMHECNIIHLSIYRWLVV